MQELLQQISEAMQSGRAKLVKQYVTQAMEEQIPALEILNDALMTGMGVIGERFKNNEIFVPEVLVAARAMNAGIDLIRPLLAAGGMGSKGTAVIGTVKGDLHDIGKNLVRMMMEGKGIEMIDLGTDVSADRFYEAAMEHHAQLVCCSTLLTTTMAEMAKRHNNANILALGGRLLTAAEAMELIDIWLDREFEGGRHQRRVDQLDAM